MKLSTQFKRLFLRGHNTEDLEKITRDFTIGFSEWLMLNCDYMPHCVWQYKGQEHTQEELLKIYEKTL